MTSLNFVAAWFEKMAVRGLLRALSISAIAVSLALDAGISAAQTSDYPSRPISLIVPLAPGSTADIVSRVIAAQLTNVLGTSVIVVNKAGAGGSIATAELAHARPDGYTIGFTGQGQMVFNLLLYANPGYTQADFAPIAMLGSVANVFVVPTSSAFHSVQDVVEHARAHPGQVTYSSGGNGTSHHLSSALFAQAGNLKLVHVPYGGAAQGTTAVMAGEVDMGIYNISTELGPIRAGKLRALAVTSAARSALLPGISTMQEAGIKDYEVIVWLGFVTPAGTPPAFIAKLHDALQKVKADPNVQKTLSNQGIDFTAAMSPQQFETYMRSDLLKWTPIIKSSGITVN